MRLWPMAAYFTNAALLFQKYSPVAECGRVDPPRPVSVHQQRAAPLLCACSSLQPLLGGATPVAECYVSCCTDSACGSRSSLSAALVAALEITRFSATSVTKPVVSSTRAKLHLACECGTVQHVRCCCGGGGSKGRGKSHTTTEG